MKILAGAVLVGAMTAGPVAATPATSLVAPLDRARGPSMGAFAGGSLTIALGASRARRVEAGLRLAPIAFQPGPDGGDRYRMAGGMTLGLIGRDAELRVGNHRLWSTAAMPAAKRRLSSAGTVGIVLGGAALIVGAVLVAQVAEGNRNSE